MWRNSGCTWEWPTGVGGKYIVIRYWFFSRRRPVRVVAADLDVSFAAEECRRREHAVGTGGVQDAVVDTVRTVGLIELREIGEGIANYEGPGPARMHRVADRRVDGRELIGADDADIRAGLQDSLRGGADIKIAYERFVGVIQLLPRQASRTGRSMGDKRNGQRGIEYQPE